LHCRKLIAFALILLSGMSAVWAAQTQAVSIRLDGNAFSVQGWQPPPRAPAAGWSSIFAVYAGSGDIPALLGNYSVEHGALVFRPRFPFTPGMTYRAVVRLPGSAPLEQSFAGPPRDTIASTRIVQVYPSADVWPSNELRIYIYFSAPMSRGEAAQHVHLLDGRGQVMRAVFLPAEELWDPDFKRLTMTFDPGRIKRGLTSNETLGPAIVPGAHYTLVIDRAWQDARGLPLVQGFSRSFTGGAALRTPPDPQRWRVSAPRAGTLQALVVDFPTPMNYPLLLRMLSVTGPVAGPIARLIEHAPPVVSGSVQTAGQETQWRFTPRTPWQAGTYQLVVDSGLEDLAGNHIGQLFDIDTFRRVTEHIVSPTITLPFSVR
jgi:hypothetical protein